MSLKFPKANLTPGRDKINQILHWEEKQLKYLVLKTIKTRKETIGCSSVVFKSLVAQIVLKSLLTMENGLRLSFRLSGTFSMLNPGTDSKRLVQNAN